MGTISEKLTYLNGTKQLLKDKINNLGGSIDDNTTFRNYANQLQNVYDNLPKTEYQEGTEINLGKTIKGKLDYDNGVVGIGQTEQESTQGYQLFEAKMPTTTYKGITVTNNGNGSFTLNGTAESGGADFRLDQDGRTGTTNPKNYENGNYTLSIGNSSVGVALLVAQFSTYATKLRVQSGNAISTGEMTDATNCFIYIFIAQGTTLNNFVITPMLVTGTYTESTLPPFEPYTGGQASPNPSYPQAINSVTGNQDVVVSGKNEFNGIYVNALTGGASPYPYTENNDCRSGIIKVEPNTTYTISKSTSNRFRISEYSTQPQVGANATNYIQAGDSATQYTLTTQSTTKYVLVQVTNQNEENVKLQLEEGSTATPYEPYITPTSYQLSLGDIELNAIGNYKDELIYDVDEDKVYKNEVIEKITLGSEEWTKESYGTNVWLLRGKTNVVFDSSIVQIMTPKFKGVSQSNRTDSFPCIYTGGRDTFFVRGSNLETLEEIQTAMNGQPIYIVKVTPTLTEITDTTLKAQVKAWYNAHSNNGTTIITSNGDLPMIIKVRGLKGE